MTPSSADALEEPAAPGTATKSPKPKVSAWPMWLLGLVIMIDQADQSVVRGMSQQLQDEFGVGEAAIGVLQSAFVLVNGIITVPAGYLADRWRRTRTIGHTVIGWSAITALGALAPNFGSLVALRASLGFGQAITEPSAASLLADYYPAEQRGRAFSVQQCLIFVGIGLGVGVGGFVGPNFGWQWGFVIVGLPGVIIAFLAYRLWEPPRGHADRLHLGVEDSGLDADVDHQLFEGGFRSFMRDMIDGLKKDLRTIWGITTMRYALVGVSTLLFTVTALGSWLFRYYEQLGLSQEEATAATAVLIIVGGIPGVLLGGRVADRYATRIRGARMAIPAYCILIGSVLFALSYMRIPFGPAFALELVGVFVMTMAIPSLRAGLSDAVPANLRGAGFGAFNLCSILFGAGGGSRRRLDVGADLRQQLPHRVPHRHSAGVSRRPRPA